MSATNALQQPLGEYLRAQVAGLPDSSGRVASITTWASVVNTWLATLEAQQLVESVEQRQREGSVVYPSHVLHALALTPMSAVRVIILGQDPYHGPGQAQGLAFSVPAGMRVPPSLRNILSEVRRDLGQVSEEAARGDLQCWARQGVLLLNTALTVEDGQPGAHARLGWERLVDALVQAAVGQALAQGRAPVLMLWGAHAQARGRLLPPVDPQGRSLVLTANHPSPLAARRPPQPFIGCGHFSRAAAFLAQTDPASPPIQW